MSTIPKGKYNWFQTGFGLFIIVHEEGDKSTYIATADNSEKAHFITTACNQLATDGREELEKENERLRVLIKEGFVLLQQHWKKPLGQIDRDWETFKIQNNL